MYILTHPPTTHTPTHAHTHTHTHPHPPPHTHIPTPPPPHTHTQNAPSRFQVVLVATDTSVEDVEVKLDIARQFAKEKQIPLVECNVEDLNHVEQAFAVVVERIMNSWDDGSSMIGQFIHRVHNSALESDAVWYPCTHLCLVWYRASIPLLMGEGAVFSSVQ